YFASFYLTNLGLSRTLLQVAWSINILYIVPGIPVYVLYVMKEVESPAKACALDRITPENFYTYIGLGYEEEKNRREERVKALNKNLGCSFSITPFYRPSEIGSDYPTLDIWDKLAEAIAVNYDCFYNSENRQKYDTIPDQFNAWINQNKLLLQTVTKLDLHDVDFTKLRLRLDQFPRLESLNLKSSKNVANFLSNIPLLNQLKTIDLTSTGLATFPASLVSQCPNLEELNLSSNEITALPEAAQLPTALKKLDLSKNKLASFPSPVSQCRDLKELDISSNKITIFPSLDQFPNLKKLNISSNEIATLPEADRLPETLKELVVSNNQHISAIPDSLLRMRVGCLIEVAGIFNFDIFQAFYRRILDIRAHTSFHRGVNLQSSMDNSMQMINGGIRRLIAERLSTQIASILAPSYEEAEVSFEQTLLFWLTEYQKNFSKFCENQSDRLPKAGVCPDFYKPLLNHPERGKLSLFLERLKASQDYIDGGTSRIQLIRRVYRMLELAAAELRFCEILFPLLHDACSTCHDRPALVFNRVEIQMELFTAKEKDEKALAKLCIGLKRFALLEKCAEERIKQLGLKDPVEVFLLYETQLREQLELPVSTQNMIFKNCAFISSKMSSEEARQALLKMLQEDAEKVLKKTQSPDDIRTILLEQEVWHARMKQVHKGAFDELEGKFSRQMEELSSNTVISDGAKDIDMKAVMTEREKASQLFVMERTTEWMASNPKL
ncbi:MAG TPA: NEL-type E3 ubiquitin ligase domain-containing protein, partial [Rhabdochlamydiaceae bacterium]|nr:NEL-type E3 ubiquitin ligase domain-containing protein [Rhabdochlamydiaceae bacterium]